MSTGYFYIISAVALFAMNGIFSRWADLPSPILLFFRFGFSFLALWILLQIRKQKVSPAGIFKDKKIILLGILNALSSIFFFYAFAYTSIAITEILFALSPVIVAIFAPFILKERLERITVVSLAISFVGVLLIVWHGDLSFGGNHLLGVLFGLSSATAYAASLLATKKIKSYDPYQLAYYQYIISLILVTPFLFFISYSLLLSKVLLLAIMGVGHAAAFVLYLKGIKTTKAQHVGILANAEVVFATIYALVIFSEVPSFSTILGGLLILVGGYLVMKK